MLGEIVGWLVVELIVAPVVEWILAPIGRAFTPIWRVFARLVNGWTVLLLWGAAIVAVSAAWKMEASASTAATWGRILLFIIPPVVAFAATIEWRSPDSPPPPRRRRTSAY